MNKKIIAILFLLILFASIAVAYMYLSQESAEEQYGSSDKTVDDSDLASEVDDSLIGEDDEVEIGEMV